VPDCLDIATELDCDEALEILEPYFVAMREVFVGEAGLKLCRRTRLYVAPWLHDSPRHFAACRDDGLVALVAPELAELPEPTVVAIFAHELGHASDYLYPGEFALDGDGQCVRRSRDSVDESQWIRWMKAWDRRDDDLVEQMADAIAEWATGSRIGYCGPCQLQAFNRGEARPQGLR